MYASQLRPLRGTLYRRTTWAAYVNAISVLRCIKCTKRKCNAPEASYGCFLFYWTSIANRQSLEKKERIAWKVFELNFFYSWSCECLRSKKRGVWLGRFYFLRNNWIENGRIESFSIGGWIFEDFRTRYLIIWI